MPGSTQGRRFTAIERLESRFMLAGSPVQRPAWNTGTGFFVLDGNVYDASGYEFVMKGPNNNHAWGSYTSNYLAIDQIGKTGANAARLVMYQDIAADSGNPWTDAANTVARRKETVERYLANGIVPVVEDHASIADGGSVQANPVGLDQIVTNWLGHTSWLKQYEQYVILNIANEWGPPANASGSNTVWRDSYITQVNRLRAGPDGNIATSADNINALIMIDAGQWGQDLNTLRLHAQQVFNADPQKNIIFSIHLYGQWRADDRPWEVSGGETDYGPWDVRSRLTALKNSGLALSIGEWAWEDFRDFSNLTAPYGAYRTRNIMQIADELGIGWLGWSWNHSSPATLNMIAGTIQNFQYNSNTDLTDWGNWLVNDPDYGTKASAARATVFPAIGLPAPTTVGLPALPSSPPSDVRFVLESTTVGVAETAQGAARVKLSRQPASDVAVNLTKIAGGSNDADVNLVTTSLTFTPANWDEYQSILLSAGADADATAGTAKFQLSSAGLVSADFLGKEIEPPTGSSFTVNPDRDRLYNGSGTATSVSVTSTYPPIGAPNGTLFMRFNLASLTGKIANATLRVFTTNITASRFVRVFGTLSDTWTESATTGINASYPLSGTGTLLPTTGGSYVDINFPALTDFVRAEHFKDGIVSLALRMVSGTATFQTREGANRPELVVSTVEAIPPQVVQSSFAFQTSPHSLSFRFSEDVSASLSAADVVLESLTDPGTVLSLGNPSWDGATSTATFAITPAIVPDGRYRATLVGSGVADGAGNPMLADSTLSFFFKSADFNHDETVNLDDFNILATNFGSASATFAEGDANFDGRVDLDDFNILASNFGQTLPASGARFAGGIRPAGVRPLAEVVGLSGDATEDALPA